MRYYVVEIHEYWGNYIISNYIEAETGIEAIDYVKQWLFENGMPEEEIESLDFIAY